MRTTIYAVFFSVLFAESIGLLPKGIAEICLSIAPPFTTRSANRRWSKSLGIADLARRAHGSGFLIVMFAEYKALWIASISGSLPSLWWQTGQKHPACCLTPASWCRMMCPYAMSRVRFISSYSARGTKNLRTRRRTESQPVQSLSFAFIQSLSLLRRPLPAGIGGLDRSANQS